MAAKVCVNYKSKKPSYIMIEDASKDWDNTTKATKAYDKGNKLSFDPEIVNHSSTTLRIRLKGKGKHSYQESKAKPTTDDNPNDPSSGTLIITVTGSGAGDITVNDAQYVNDDPGT
jgi:hypothetical protein